MTDPKKGPSGDAMADDDPRKGPGAKPDPHAPSQAEPASLPPEEETAGSVAPEPAPKALAKKLDKVSLYASPRLGAGRWVVDEQVRFDPITEESVTEAIDGGAKVIVASYGAMTKALADLAGVVKLETASLRVIPKDERLTPE